MKKLAEIQTSLVVEEKVDAVYEKAKDIEGLAEYLPDLEEVRILRREKNMVESFWKGVFQGREVKWTERDYWDDENKECRFEAVEGDFKLYRGIWRFNLEGESKTRVDLEIEYDLGLPLVGPLINTFLKKKMLENARAMLNALEKSLHG